MLFHEFMTTALRVLQQGHGFTHSQAYLRAMTLWNTADPDEAAREIERLEAQAKLEAPASAALAARVLAMPRPKKAKKKVPPSKPVIVVPARVLKK